MPISTHNPHDRLTRVRRNLLRATELAEKITDTLGFCERLATVVEGDVRAGVTR
ncbi:hypothetical protein [Mycobacterium gastri]|uniref:hypothetical protein n=1 Tax=Mycobacterium gastri TaxID=1777 RepID=UPI0003E598C0|nr:hypothetical protein [Mycobacterium gastri]ETW26507.1 hypothetical protein MGAST_18110 [Mycobacterium gastri 'Wayne']